MGKEAKDAGGDLEDLSDSFDDISDATGEGADAAEEFEPHYYSGTYLDVLVKNEAVQHYIKDYSFVQRYESVRDHEQKTVPNRID